MGLSDLQLSLWSHTYLFIQVSPIPTCLHLVYLFFCSCHFLFMKPFIIEIHCNSTRLSLPVSLSFIHYHSFLFPLSCLRYPLSSFLLLPFVLFSSSVSDISMQVVERWVAQRGQTPMIVAASFLILQHAEVRGSTWQDKGKEKERERSGGSRIQTRLLHLPVLLLFNIPHRMPH